jgi:NAD(P)-dependent dehydrogenase (short-subunit alcohol dehydrogenase family)
MNNKSVVLISGCSSGIGYALANAFASRRYRVFATARKPSTIKQLESENIDIAMLDVTDQKSIESCVRDVVRKAGRIDVLVNNAGYALIGPVIELPSEEIRKQFETNLVGLVALSKAVVPHMIEQGRGRIVNISSVSGVFATPFAGAYCASKAAVNCITDSMRIELAPFGIQVITVQPGGIQSNFGSTAAKNIPHIKKSFYAPIARYIEARAYASQKNSTTAGEFAHILVEKLSKKNVPTLIRIGKSSTRLPFLAKLPFTVTDRMMSKNFGLNKIKIK